jgi:23S rRNA (guanosine2251-2'-O)-methyltransferase
MTEPVYLYGRNPLQEALLAHKRGSPLPIKKLYLAKFAEENPSIMSLVQTNKLDYVTVTPAEIDSMIGKGMVHQGVCALLDESMLYTPLEQVLATASQSSKNSLFVLLDELQDPHNVGAIIRSAVAFGATAILLPDHSSVGITGTVIKSSSGMTFVIPIVKIGNVNTTLLKLKEKSFWTYGLTGDGDSSLHATTFDANTVLVIGSEGTGIPKKTLEHCDFKLSIKTSPLCESLNASNAAFLNQLFINYHATYKHYIRKGDVMGCRCYWWWSFRHDGGRESC